MEYKIRRGIIDYKLRKLVLNDEYIKYDNDLFSINNFKQIQKEEISDFKYGIKWINGYQFIIGREYQIVIKSKSNEVIKVSFKSYYGYKKKKSLNLYQNIFNEIWDNYFSKITNNLLDRFYSNEEILINEVFITKTGIKFKSGLLSTSTTFIKWDDLRTSNYQTYFVIYSIKNSKKINRAYYYIDDWNTGVLYSFLRTILNEKGIEKHNDN